MFKKTTNTYYKLGAVMTTGMVAVSSTAAHANNFGSIANNINSSIATLPGLVTSIAYLFGVLLSVLGIMKIKDHVENPTQTPLKDGAIRLVIGGALFALPIVLEAMTNTVGSGSGATTALISSVTFNTQ